ncbi:MAG: DinB family protein [Ignavibacteria bacterium]|nr:DinB family protein [Ignavibacteria bacterium]
MNKEHINTKLEPQLSLLWWILEDVRKVTLRGIEGLTKEQLFKSPIEGEYPIGAYLMHLAEAEVYWLQVISDTKVNVEIKKRLYYGKWFDPNKGKAEGPEEPLEVKEYLDALRKVRELLRNYIFTMKDAELEEIIIYKWEGGEDKISKKWIIYHLIEHEAHHRGQMMMLIRKASFKKNK